MQVGTPTETERPIHQKSRGRPTTYVIYPDTALLQRTVVTSRAGGYMQKLRGLERGDLMPLAAPNDARIARPQIDGGNRAGFTYHAQLAGDDIQDFVSVRVYFPSVWPISCHGNEADGHAIDALGRAGFANPHRNT